MLSEAKSAFGGAKILEKRNWLILVCLLIFFGFGWFYFYNLQNLSLVLILVLALAVILGFFWSKKLEAGLLVLMASLFFERFPTIEVSGLTLKISFIIGLSLIFAWLWQNFKITKIKKFKSQPKLLYRVLLVFWLVILISLLINSLSFRSIAVFLLISFCFTLFLVLSNTRINQRSIQKINLIIIWGSFIICLFAFWQYFADLAGVSTKWTLLQEHYTLKIFGFPRVHSTFLEPLLMANFLLIPICLIISLWLKKQIKTKFFAPLLIIFLVIFIVTISRGAYLALLVAGIFLVIFAFKEIFQWRKILFLLLILAISGLVAFGMIRVAGSQALANFVEQGETVVKKPEEQGFSTAHRLMTFKIAFQAFKEHPILGIGPGNFGSYYDNYPMESLPKTEHQTVNNQYLEILAENGILGLAAFILFLIILFIRSWRAYRITKNPLISAFILGATTALVGILAQYNFFSTLYIIYIWFLMGLLVSIQEIVLTRAGSNFRKGGEIRKNK